MMRNKIKMQTLHHRRRENLQLPPLKNDVIKPAMIRKITAVRVIADSNS